METGTLLLLLMKAEMKTRKNWSHAMIYPLLMSIVILWNLKSKKTTKSTKSTKSTNPKTNPKT